MAALKYAQRPQVIKPTMTPDVCHHRVPWPPSTAHCRKQPVTTPKMDKSVAKLCRVTSLGHEAKQDSTANIRVSITGPEMVKRPTLIIVSTSTRTETGQAATTADVTIKTKLQGETYTNARPLLD